MSNKRNKSDMLIRNSFLHRNPNDKSELMKTVAALQDRNRSLQKINIELMHELADALEAKLSLEVLVAQLKGHNS